jgi:hypothetical protein
MFDFFIFIILTVLGKCQVLDNHSDFLLEKKNQKKRRKLKIEKENCFPYQIPYFNPSKSQPHKNRSYKKKSI